MIPSCVAAMERDRLCDGVEDAARAGDAVGGQFLDARFAHRHQRELRGDKQAVQEDERGDGEQSRDIPQPESAPMSANAFTPAPLLRRHSYHSRIEERGDSTATAPLNECIGGNGMEYFP